MCQIVNFRINCLNYNIFSINIFVTLYFRIGPFLNRLDTVYYLEMYHSWEWYNIFIIKKQAASLNPVTPGDLAGSIGAALITTVAGLMVAIPTLVAYNYLVSRVNAFVLEMDRASAELLNFLSHLSELNQTITEK